MIENHETQFNNIINIVTKYPNRPMSSIYEDELSETSIMSGLFSNSFMISNDVLTYFLKYKYTDVYKDMEKTVRYYDSDYQIVLGTPSTHKSIINMDVSYYCSQNMLKYFFLLDILVGMYAFKASHKNVDGRITIMTRYIVVDGVWMQDNTRPASSFVIKFQYNKMDGTSRFVVLDEKKGIDSFSNMCRAFEKDIVRHLNYMNKVDITSGNTDYLTNLSAFYMLCRLKLVYYVLLCSNEINKDVSGFMERHVSYCFINLKNYISLKNVNNNSIVLTKQLITKTDELKRINENLAQNDDKIKRSNKNRKALRYNESKYLLYSCLAVAVFFSVVLFAMYGIGAIPSNSNVGGFIIMFVIVLYIVVNYVIHSRKRSVENFNSMDNISGLTWTKYERANSSIIRYPREPLGTYTKRYLDGTNVRCRASSELSKGIREVWHLFNWKSNAFPPVWVTNWHYTPNTGFSRMSQQYFNNDTGYFGEYVIIDLGEEIILQKYILEAMGKPQNYFGDYTRSTPHEFRIYATNDNSSYSNIRSGRWVKIDERFGITYSMNSLRREFTLLSNEIKYRYYAIVVRRIFPSAPHHVIVLSQWEIYGIPSKYQYLGWGKGKFLQSGTIINTSQISTPQHSIYEYTGIFYTKEFSGDFTFYITSDHDSYLWIANTIVIDNNGLRGERERAGTVNLKAYTYYPIDMYINNKSKASIHFSHASINKTSNGKGHYFPFRLDGLQWTKRTEYQKYDQGAVLETGYHRQILNSFRNSGELYNVEYNGLFFTKSFSGIFTFFTVSADESFLWIDDKMVVNNGGLHSLRERRGSINLKENTYYPIKIRFGNNYGPGELSVFFSHASIPKTSNGNGFFYTTGQYKQWHDEVELQYTKALERLQSKLRLANDAAKKAEEELKKKADLEKQYFNNLEELKGKIKNLDNFNDDIKKKIAEKENLIVEKDIEIKMLWLKFATAETERARNFAEAERQRALKEKQQVMEYNLKQDIKDYEFHSNEIKDLNKKLEDSIKEQGIKISERENALNISKMKKAEEEAKLLAAKIKERSNNLLIAEEELINRKLAAELNVLKYNVEISRKASEDALKEKQRVEGLTKKLNVLDVKFANEHLSKMKAEQKKQEQIYVTNEARIRAHVATDIAYARKTHYDRIKAQFDSMVIEQETNEVVIDDTQDNIVNLERNLDGTLKADVKAQEQAIIKFDSLEDARKRENTSLKNDIRDAKKNIIETKKKIEEHIRDFINERNMVIDTNKTLRETSVMLFNQMYRLQQYKFVSNVLSIDSSLSDITTKISANIDNVIMMISNSIVTSSLQTEVNDMANLDEHIDVSAHKAINSVEIISRDTKVADATTRLVLNLFVLTVFIIVAKKKYVITSSLLKFGLVYSLVVFYYFMEVVIIVRTNASNKYWQRPEKDTLVRSA